MSFLTIGHRGLMGIEPENTVRSFVRADREPMDMIELDLHLSKDGHLVVMHDADVDRTTDGSGPIADFTLEELRRLDAGLGERVPVFEEVVEAVKAPLQAEIKDVAAARRLAEVITGRDLLGRVDVISFHDEALAEIRRLLPAARTALVAEHYDLGVIERALAVGAFMLSLDIRRLTLELVEKAHANGLQVIAWTVNTVEELKISRGLGLEGVVTDVPEIKRSARYTA
ncbi:Glycerophosphodiester phosphodiesterase [Streptomyces sp. RB5]|uniref:Glycerophosphodiester phosphodiesterase n=1 Tax=Streptomyces smaragdinus TaxID=2585196 RepID=A0A7K0CEG3_9ACTN|nr:glycerophosphodiester phosphodiesterase family protein [Streptomyces smaragdinus]MQY11733.1 Glycerophosphodiester phosphodiesterase [Streptomyces smaragdinus]